MRFPWSRPAEKAVATTDPDDFGDTVSVGGYGAFTVEVRYDKGRCPPYTVILYLEGGGEYWCETLDIEQFHEVVDEANTRVLRHALTHTLI